MVSFFIFFWSTQYFHEFNMRISETYYWICTVEGDCSWKTCTSVLGIHWLLLLFLLLLVLHVLWYGDMSREIKVWLNNDNHIREYKLNKVSDFSITLWLLIFLSLLVCLTSQYNVWETCKKSVIIFSQFDAPSGQKWHFTF